MRRNRAPLILLTFATILFVCSYIMLIVSGINPFVALLWNTLASLGISVALLPSAVTEQPLILIATLVDAFVFALVAVVLAALFFEFIKQINIRKRFVLSRVKKLKQHIIVVPFNNFAISIVKELGAAGERCVVIAENEPDAHRIYRMGHLGIVGDPKNIEAFAVAGIGRAKYVIACADEDVQNALITITAKSANARARIISRVSDLDNISKLGSAGAFRMIMPEITVGTEIGEEIIKRVLAQ